jgi:hypothetical protein
MTTLDTRWCPNVLQAASPNQTTLVNIRVRGCGAASRSMMCCFLSYFWFYHSHTKYLKIFALIIIELTTL